MNNIDIHVSFVCLVIFYSFCLSGLDPAQPNFANFDIQIRLDQSDAVFVDAIHTDGSDYDTISGNLEVI